MAVSCPSVRFNCHKNAKLLCTRCASQAQNALELVFADAAYNASPDPWLAGVIVVRDGHQQASKKLSGERDALSYFLLTS